MTVVLLLFALVLIGAGLFYGLAALGSRTGPMRADEIHYVLTPDLWRVRLCRFTPQNGGGEPVFLCHGFMSNHANFTLPPGASPAELLTERGYDCWAIDLRGSLSSIPPFGRSREEPTLDDYVVHDIPAALDYIAKQTGYPKAHWIGHSMGGMLLYAHLAASGGERLASGVAIGSPVCFPRRFGSPALALAVRWLLRGRAFRGLLRLLLSAAFRLKLQSRIAPVNWSNMHPAIGPELGFQAIEASPLAVGRELAFAARHNMWRVKDDEVDVFESIPRLRLPLFAIFGAADPLTPLAPSEALIESIAGHDKQLMILSREDGFEADYSHLDLVFGRNARDEVFEPVVEWLWAHPISREETAEPAKVKPKAEPKPARAKASAAPKKAAGPKKTAAPRKRARGKPPAVAPSPVETEEPSA